MNGSNVWTVLLVVMIDGVIISAMSLLIYKAWVRFDSSACVNQLTVEDHQDKADAWHLLAIAGFIGAVASFFTGMLLVTAMVLIPIIISIVLMIVASAIASDHRRAARRHSMQHSG